MLSACAGRCSHALHGAPRAARCPPQVDGDQDSEEEEDTGMGDIDVEAGPAFLTV